MSLAQDRQLFALTATAVGAREAAALFGVLDIDPALAAPQGETVSRAVFAMAMNAVLFHDLLARAPTGAAYVEDVRQAGGRVIFDHGALRTIRFGQGPTGALPPGQEAFVRILEPLGYEMAGLYPLDRLGMTGRAYAHRDLPEAIPQFFVSELHVERFSPVFQDAAARVFGATRDPLGVTANAALAAFADTGACPAALAVEALPRVAAAFGRWHDAPALADYRLLLAESPEAAWIATEGQAFNHATDRVARVEETAEAQRARGRPIKDAVEVSASGRVRQTAFKADPTLRAFVGEDSGAVEMSVPGSFYEFISRDAVVGEDGIARLDLRFDSSNAQGIFKMTQAAA